MRVEARGLQLTKRDARDLSPHASIEFQRHIPDARDGAFEESLVDMADLLDVKRPVRERTPLEGLDGFEQQQHRAVVDGQRLGAVLPPRRAFEPSFEEREAIGIEERAAHRGHAQRRMIDAAKDRSEHRE